jgi:DNA-binding NtrC family response regulator
MAATAVTQSAAKSRTSRILLVTDDELLRHRISQIFAKDHYELTFWKPEGRFRQYLSRLSDTDIVVLDIWDSLKTALRSLQSFKKEHPRTKVILLVPQSQMYWWIEAINMGAWECLPKPVEWGELKAVLIHASQTACQSNQILEKKARLKVSHEEL